MFRGPTLCILIWISTFAYNQEFSISIGSGIGTYQMKDLKNLQNSMLENMPVLAKIVNDFPASPIYSVEALYHMPKFHAGVNYMFNTSGSRIHYADYSGEVSVIQVVNSHQGGILIYPVLYHMSKSEFLGLFKTALLFNSYSLKQELTVFDETASDNTNLKSNSVALSFGLAYCIRFKFLVLRTEAEYLVDFGGPLHLAGDPKVIFYDSRENPITTNWSGFRIGFSTGWYF